jgi:hypothetical protein
MAEAKETTPKEEFNKKLDRIVDAGMEKTRRFYTMWNENLRYFFSDQLHGVSTRKNWEWVVINYIWPSAMQEIAKLTKNNPKIIVQPWTEDDSEKAEVWEKNLQWDWKQGINGHGMRLEQIKSIFDKKIFGYSVSRIYWEDKCYWDDQQKQWLGDPKHKLWHPSLFWADAEENIDDGNCGTERYATLDWAIDRWPKYKQILEDEAKSYKEVKKSFYGYDTGGSRSILQGSKANDGTDTVRSGGSDSSVPALPNRMLEIIAGFDPMQHEPVENDIKLVKIQEIFLKDYAEETVKESQPRDPGLMLETGEIYEADGVFYDTKSNTEIMPEDWPTDVVNEYKQPKYPTGRYIMRVGDTILNPKPEDQRYPYSRWPFVVTPHYLLPHMWQGVDSVQLYKSTQDMVNITVSHLYNNLKQFGDPKVAVETGAIETPPGRNGKHYKIGAGSGSIIRLVKGALSRGAFKILDPPQPPAQAVALYQLFAQEYKNIQGMQSIAMGEKTPGKMSATESVHLATSSVDRIALQAVYEDYWVVECCKLIAEMKQRNYDIGRWIRIVGEEGVAGVQQITQDLLNIRYDISIIPGTTLPFDEEKRAAKYIQAYQLMADPNPNPMLPEVLRVLDIHNWRKILQQHAGWQQFMQFNMLLESVKAGETDPQQALQLLAQGIQQAAMSAQQAENNSNTNQTATR